MKNREGYYVAEHERECTRCSTIFKKTSKTVALCNFCNSERVKNSKSVEYKLWERARNRCKTSGRVFDIEVADIKIPRLCPYLGVELIPHQGTSGGKPYSPSLDRINNEGGYTKDNIQVISHLANQMKANASPEELVKFAKSILLRFGTD